MTSDLRRERQDYVVSLRIQGLSIATIVQMVNGEAEGRGWNKVSRRTVEQDLAQFYRENNASSLEEYDHSEQMRKAHLASMDATIEKLSVHIRTTKNWKPFEYVNALDTLQRMQRDYAEIENWNLGRKNPEVTVNNFSIQNTFEGAQRAMQRSHPAAIAAALSMIDNALHAMDEDPAGEKVAYVETAPIDVEAI